MSGQTSRKLITKLRPPPAVITDKAWRKDVVQLFASAAKPRQRSGTELMECNDWRRKSTVLIRAAKAMCSRPRSAESCPPVRRWKETTEYQHQIYAIVGT